MRFSPSAKLGCGSLAPRHGSKCAFASARRRSLWSVPSSATASASLPTNGVGQRVVQQDFWNASKIGTPSGTCRGTACRSISSRNTMSSRSSAFRNGTPHQVMMWDTSGTPMGQQRDSSGTKKKHYKTLETILPHFVRKLRHRAKNGSKSQSGSLPSLGPHSSKCAARFALHLRTGLCNWPFPIWRNFGGRERT